MCERCAAQPSCDSCGLPRAHRNAGDDGWCTRCLDAAPRCASCGLPIRNQYWRVPGSDARYCSRCESETVACSVCGAPDRAGRLVDGRFFCRSCGRATVDDVADWKRVYSRLLDRARTTLGLELADPPPLVVDDATTLRERRDERGAPDGLCGLYVRDSHGRTSIHVLSHLPAPRGTAVIAHELAHAWQAENAPDGQGTRVREGFAEWVAWRLLEGWDGGDRERAVIEARTDDYGTGFRLFRDLEKRGGVPHAIWYASAARNGG